MEPRHVFSRFASQLVVLCLLLLFVVLSLVAMFSTADLSNEVEWIGITAAPLGAEEAAARGIPGDVGGVVIEEADGIAARAGVRPGDVLLAVNGQRIQDLADFSRVTGETDVSKGAVQLDVIRRGSRMPVLVLPSHGATQAPRQTTPGRIIGPPAAVNRRWLGIEAETFAAGEGRELGIPAGVAGVLVDAVTRGSRAEQAGLSVNDVIVSVNGRRIDSTAGLWSTLAGLDSGDPVEFGVYKNGQLTSVVLSTAAGALAGGFPGRMGGQGLGPGGTLVCPNCGTRVAHQWGVPCYSVPCPSCGTSMMRVQ